MALPVYYNEDSVCRVESFSPSSHKPQLVVEDWKSTYGDAIELRPHGIITYEELLLVHDYDYVDAVMKLKLPNGFGTRSNDVLKSVLHTNGGMVAAAHGALGIEGRYPVCVAPYSGFHHAGHNFGGGYCTFNGLVLAALSVIHASKADTVLILDCDYHWGNGTADILLSSGNEYTTFIEHFTAGELYNSAKDARKFLAELPKVIRRHKEVDLVLYQAGADQHLDDPLGGMLTSKQMRERDRIVFQECGEFGLPIVWNLAGGYQEPIAQVLDLHRATVEECLTTFGP